MNKRVLKVLGLLAALSLAFVVGAVAGGGIVFAATQALNPDGEPVAVPHQGDPEPGIVIASVVADGPAAQAGLKRGDILLKINGEAVDHAWALIRYLSDLEIGGQVELTLLHGDEERTLTATLGDRDGQPYLGLVPCASPPGELVVVTERMAFTGTPIIEVMPDSPAEEAGLEVGDLIVAVGGQELDDENNLADLIAQYGPGDTVTLEVKRPGEESREVTVQLGEHPEEEGKAYLGVRYPPAPYIYRFRGRDIPLGGRHFDMRPFEDEMRFVFPEGDIQRGAIVRRVAEDSPAEAAGLKRDDIIIAIEGEPIEAPEALVDAVAERKPGDVLKLTVYRLEDEETLDLEVTLAEHPEEEGKAYLGVLTHGFFRIRRFEGTHDGLENLERHLEFELPFDELPLDLEIEPHRFEFRMPPDDCCDGEPSRTI